MLNTLTRELIVFIQRLRKSFDGVEKLTTSKIAFQRQRNNARALWLAMDRSGRSRDCLQRNCKGGAPMSNLKQAQRLVDQERRLTPAETKVEQLDDPIRVIQQPRCSHES